MPRLPLLFLFKEGFKLVAQLIPIPFFSFHLKLFFKHLAQIGFSFCTFRAALSPRNFIFFHSASSTVKSAETSVHFPSSFACFQASTELCPPLLPAVCCHVVFVERYHSLLIHLSFFSVMVFFKTAVVFSTLDLFLLLSGEPAILLFLC